MNGYLDSNRIAERIKHVRISRGLTQLEMGDKLGYSERQVRRLETEGTLNLGVINLISEVFNISCKDILFDEEDVFLWMWAQLKTCRNTYDIKQIVEMLEGIIVDREIEDT